MPGIAVDVVTSNKLKRNYVVVVDDPNREGADVVVVVEPKVKPEEVPAVLVEPNNGLLPNKLILKSPISSSHRQAFKNDMRPQNMQPRHSMRILSGKLIE